jgi:chemotaxis protein MotB
MMTFSDITTLLLTFFILIMTFSTVEKEKLQKAQGSFQGAFGTVSAKLEKAVSAVAPRQIPISDRVHDQGAEVPRRQAPSKVAKVLHQLIDGERIILSRTDRHSRVRFPDSRAFAPGSARVKYTAVRRYRETAKLLREYPNVVVVEGHTDDAFLPSEEFPTAWDLAAARASAVAAILRGEGFPESQIQIRSYGATRPEVANSTTLNRARNRRVDLLVLGSEEKGMGR